MPPLSLPEHLPVVTVTVGARPPEEETNVSSCDPEAEQTRPDGPSEGADQAIQEQLGMAVQPLTADIARDIGIDRNSKGLVIAAVASRSDAGAKGLRRGDVILSINSSPVTTAEALAKGVADAKKAGRSAVLLEILRRGQQPAFVAIRGDGN